MAARTYAEFWDGYVESFKAKPDAGVAWPGDEWGTPERWEKDFKALFLDVLSPDVRTAMEIGPGAGKYTLRFLESFRQSRVIACDVSAAYLKVLQERCAAPIAAGRLVPELMPLEHDCLDRIAARHGMVGTLDVVFSMDAMVHVDLQYLMAYWISAGKLLRPGGRIIMTVADATSPGGFQKLVSDVPALFRKQGSMSSKFEWLSPQLATFLLDRLGFEVRPVRTVLSHRDFCFVATKR